VTAPAQKALPAELWRERQRAHAARVDAWTGPHLARRRLGQAHPVEDFLFTYYSLRPAQLRRWHPGSDHLLEGASASELGRDHVDVPGGARLDVAAALTRLGATLRWVGTLLQRTAERPALLGCFGLHEWAMVYRQPAEQLRHSAHPLRLGSATTDTVVESLPLRCSHADAFRFFTAAARPLNVTAVTRDRQLELEQPGCLHAGMDLYKWAYKLGPLVPSELVADTFSLARDIRLLDMQASPYDLSDLGVEPVQVETAEGRSEYAERQRAFAERSGPLRAAVLAHCERWLAAADQMQMRAPLAP
jgi:hypothetical protein